MRRLWLVILLALIAFACQYTSPSAPTRIGWLRQGFGSVVIDVPLHVAAVQVDLYAFYGECGPCSVADIDSGILSGRICPGESLSVPVKLKNGNTLKIVVPQETRWTISETESR